MSVCCPVSGGGWQIHDFVCEHYAAPDTFIIGLNRNYADAEAFCQSQYHGVRVHKQSVFACDSWTCSDQIACVFTAPGFNQDPTRLR